MTIRFGCPSCLNWLTAAPKVAGKGILCPACRKLVRIPQPQVDAGSGQTVVQWQCPQCSNPFRLIDELHGRQIRCRSCQGTFLVSSQPWALLPPRSGNENGLGRGPLHGNGAKGAGKKTAPAGRNGNGRSASPADKLPAPSNGNGHPPSALANGTAKGKPVGAAGVAAAALAGAAEAGMATPPQGTTAALVKEGPVEGMPSALPERVNWTRMPHERRLAGERLSSTGLLKAGIAGGVALVAAVVLAALLLWPSGRATEPRLAYLPNEFGVYTTLDVAAMLKSPLYRATLVEGKGGLPLPSRINLFENFLGSAGLKMVDAHRISYAGDPQGRTAGVVIYELQREITGDELLKHGSLGKHVVNRDTVGGQPYYDFEGYSVYLANSKLIVVSRTETLRQVIGRWRTTIPANMRLLVQNIDAKKTSVSAQLGPPLGHFRFLGLAGREYLSQVQSTVDQADIGAAVDYSRVMQMPDQAAATRLADAITAGLERAAPKVRNPRVAQPVLLGVKIARGEHQVQISLHLSKPITDDDALGLVSDIFSL